MKSSKFHLIPLALLLLTLCTACRDKRTDSLVHIAEQFSEVLRPEHVVAVVGILSGSESCKHHEAIVRESLTTELVKAGRGKYRVKARTLRRKVLEELIDQHTGNVDPQKAAEVGREVGATHLVGGLCLEKNPEGAVLFLRLIHVESGLLKAAAKITLKEMQKDFSYYYSLICNRTPRIIRVYHPETGRYVPVERKGGQRLMRFRRIPEEIVVADEWKREIERHKLTRDNMIRRRYKDTIISWKVVVYR
jgi:hypothetical protein